MQSGAQPVTGKILAADCYPAANAAWLADGRDDQNFLVLSRIRPNLDEGFLKKAR